MNHELTWHIVKKDLYRARLALAFWGVTGAYLAIYPRINVSHNSIWDNFGIVCIFTHAALALTLIAAFIQEDSVMDSSVFWRTRPIAAGRLLVAKLGLLLTLFMVIPVLAFAFGIAVEAVPNRKMDALWPVVFVCSTVVLSAAAVAACTKDLARYFLTGLISVFAAGSIGNYLFTLAAKPPVMERVRAGNSKMAAILILCALAAAGILYLQYFKRWRIVSFVLLGFAVLGSSLIGAFWTWRFLP